MDKWRYNFDIINGPDNIVFVDASLSYFDIALGYHLEYNPNGILWKVNAAGTPAPQDSLNFEEQNRIIETATKQTVKEIAPQNLTQQDAQPGWCDPLQSMKVRGADVEIQKSNMFGWVRNDGSKLHQGIDFAAKTSTPTIAIRKGLILEIKDDPTSTTSYGSYVILQFEQAGKTYFALYAHLSKINVVSNQAVEAGQVLGLTGTSGNASGMEGEEQHLHFEIATTSSFGSGLDTRIDPMPFLNMNNGMQNLIPSGGAPTVRGPETTVASGSAPSNDSVPENLEPSEKIVSYLMDYERYKKFVYDAGDGKMTIGYGHVLLQGESYPNGISEEDARALLKKDLKDRYTAVSLDPFLTKYSIKLTQNQYDALVNFTYNVGEYIWDRPADDFKLKRLLIAGNFTDDDITEAMTRYVLVTNEKTGVSYRSGGVWRRRMDEADMFNKGIYDRNSTRAIPDGFE
ncbi:MAG: peptidase [Bacteroidetes bacterium]|nr:peptidase [Bacteroidota bacterium]